MTFMVKRGVGDYATGEAGAFMYRKASPLNGTEPIIIALHSFGTTEGQWQPGRQGASELEASWISRQVVDAGFLVYSIMAGGDTFGNSAGQGYVGNAITKAQAWGGRTGKVGLLGWSMGGWLALNYIAAHLTGVFAAVLLAPASDGDLAWALGGSTQAGLDAAYGGSWAANGKPTYNPIQNAAAFRGGPKVRIYQGSADTVVTPAQTAAFVTAVNDPAVSSVTATGADHATVPQFVAPSDVAAFFAANLA